MYEDDQSVMAAIRAGVSGYLLKGASQQEILRAIQAVGSGDALFFAAIAKRIVAHLNQSPPGTLDRSVRELPDLTPPGEGDPGPARRGAVQPRHRAPLGYQPEDGRQPPVRRLRQAAGQRPNPTSGSYYDEGHWTAEGACSGLRRLVGASHRTLSTYLTTLRRHGLWLDGLAEPLPHPGWDPAHDAGRQPVFLVAWCIKLPSADITQVRQSLVRKSAGVVDGFDGVAEVVADSASPSATG